MEAKGAIKDEALGVRRRKAVGMAAYEELPSQGYGIAQNYRYAERDGLINKTSRHLFRRVLKTSLLYPEPPTKTASYPVKIVLLSTPF